MMWQRAGRWNTPATSRPSTSAVQSVSLPGGDPDHCLGGHGPGVQGQADDSESLGLWAAVLGWTHDDMHAFESAALTKTTGNDWLGVSALAKKLGVATRTLYRILDSDELPAYRSAG